MAPRLWLGILCLPVLAGLAAAGPAATDTARFAYEHGFTAVGDFQGTCETTGAQFTGYGSTGSFAFHADQTSLVVLETWYNYTVLVPGGPLPASFNTVVEQSVRDIPVPWGDFVLAWHSGSRWFLTEGYEGSRDVGNLTTPLEGSAWLVEPPVRILSAGPGTYHEPTDYGPVRFPHSMPGPARFVSTGQAVLPISGDGWLKFDNATLVGNDFRLELPDYIQEMEPEQPTPAAQKRIFLLTHAVLRVQGFHADLEGAWTKVGCRDLDWSGNGAVTYRRAVGTVARGNESNDFERQELTLQGAFDSHERPVPAQRPWGEIIEVQTESAGSFDTVGIDFAAVPVPPAAPAPALAAVGLLALVLGAAALVLKKSWPILTAYFTRELKEPVLQHDLRSTIHNLVRDRPGLNLTEVVQLTGKQLNVVRHHAAVLQRYKVLTVHRVGREQCLYPVGVSREDALRKYVIEHNPPVQFLREYLRGGSQSFHAGVLAIQQRFGFGRSGAARVIARAERAGLVVRESSDSGVVLRAP